MIDLEPIRHFLIVFGMSIARLTAACTVAPFLGNSVVSGQVRNSMMFAFGLMIFPIVSPSAPQDLGTPVELAALLGKEVVIGILLGFVASKVFWIAMSVGFLIDNQRGASMASVFDPNSGTQTSPFGLLLQQAIIVVFYTSGAFLLFLGGMFESYTVWPVFSFAPNFNNAFPAFAIGQVDDVMRMTVIIAAPVVITVFVAEFGLGLVNRFAPQLNVFFLAMPVKSIIAVIVLALYLPYVFSLFGEQLSGADSLRKMIENVVE